jgi:chorismate synthase
MKDFLCKLSKETVIRVIAGALAAIILTGLHGMQFRIRHRERF